MSLERAKYDWNRFSTNGGFQVNATLTPTGGQPVSIKCLGTKHHNSIGTDGIPVNSKNVHVSLNESYLTGLGLTVRNSNKEINFRNWLISFADSSGVVKNYIIKETQPDETTGMIICFLADYGS